MSFIFSFCISSFEFKAFISDLVLSNSKLFLLNFSSKVLMLFLHPSSLSWDPIIIWIRSKFNLLEALYLSSYFKLAATSANKLNWVFIFFLFKLSFWFLTSSISSLDFVKFSSLDFNLFSTINLIFSNSSILVLNSLIFSLHFFSLKVKSFIKFFNLIFSLINEFSSRILFWFSSYSEAFISALYFSNKFIFSLIYNCLSFIKILTDISILEIIYWKDIINNILKEGE